MVEPIDTALAHRLDAYTVPSLPAGFADRLVAATLEESAPPVSPFETALPTMRRPAARRWLRRGATGLGAIAVGMISISAAAMGYFGEPIRLAVHEAPVVGNQSPVLVLAIHGLESFVLMCVAAIARGIHHQQDLALKLAQRLCLARLQAVERVLEQYGAGGVRGGAGRYRFVRRLRERGKGQD